MLSTFLIILTLGIDSLFAQEPKIHCPQGSILGEDTTLFMVTIPPKELYPHIGDFYSNSWQKIIFPQENITFTPPTRTLTFHDKTLHELLLSNSSSPTTDTFSLRWELLSETYSPTGRFDIMYYQQAISVIPVCSGGLLSSVAWKTRVCVSGDMGLAMGWFVDLYEGAAGNIFSGIAEGWMEGKETGVGNCYGLNGSAVGNSTSDDGGGVNLGDDDGRVSYTPVPEMQSMGVRGDIGCVVTVGVVLVGLFTVL